MDELLGISIFILIFGVAIPYVLIERGLKKEFGWKIGFWDHLGNQRDVVFQLHRVLEYRRLKKARTGRIDVKVSLIFISFPIGILSFIAWVVLNQLK